MEHKKIGAKTAPQLKAHHDLLAENARLAAEATREEASGEMSSQHALNSTLKRLRQNAEPGEPAEQTVVPKVVPAETGHVEPGAPTALQACYFRVGITGRPEATREAIAAPSVWLPRTDLEQQRPSQRRRSEEPTNYRSVCHGCGRPRRECGVNWGKDTCAKPTCRCGRPKSDHPGVPAGPKCTWPPEEARPPAAYAPPRPLLQPLPGWAPMPMPMAASRP